MIRILWDDDVIVASILEIRLPNKFNLCGHVLFNIPDVG